MTSPLVGDTLRTGEKRSLNFKTITLIDFGKAILFRHPLKHKTYFFCTNKGLHPEVTPPPKLFSKRKSNYQANKNLAQWCTNKLNHTGFINSFSLFSFHDLVLKVKKASVTICPFQPQQLLSNMFLLAFLFHSFEPITNVHFGLLMSHLFLKKIFNNNYLHHNCPLKILEVVNIFS